MHCFSDNWDVCRQWMTDWPGMKFGFTPDYYSWEVVLNIPLDRLLCETDSPYFVPLVEVWRTDCVCVLIHAEFRFTYACCCGE
jgi:Tat protein secretion system quality control protein TatD with DNase activity